jgi:hypothetical protein
MTTEFPPVIHGGLGTAVGGLANASARAGMAVGVLLVGETGLSAYGHRSTAGGALTARPQPSGDGAVQIFPVSWYDEDRVVSIVRNWKAHLLHLHSFWLWHLAGRIRRDLQVPLVYTVHSLEHRGKLL